ncbi:uncharacterized protein LOC116582236 [Mustela erminea]|uniref:uncharacterized protein LOC116582236 n=1 Tax=Mustela erminea TaxID=36723 RepID=UPI0013875641|nr:uncharacterized protein LOC116582236 [Mustela erminea]
MQDLRIQRQTRFSWDHPCGTTSVPLTQGDSPSEASDWLFCRLGSPGAVKMGKARYVPVLSAADPPGNKLVRGPRPCGALDAPGNKLVRVPRALRGANPRTPPSPAARIRSAFPYSTPTTRRSRWITTTGATAHRSRVSGALPLLSPRSPRSERGARARRRGEGAGSALSMGKMGRVADSDSVGVLLRRDAATRACEHFPRRVAHSGEGRAGAGREWASGRRDACGGVQRLQSRRLGGRGAVSRAVLLRTGHPAKPRSPLPSARRNKKRVELRFPVVWGIPSPDLQRRVLGSDGPSL